MTDEATAREGVAAEEAIEETEATVEAEATEEADEADAESQAEDSEAEEGDGSEEGAEDDAETESIEFDFGGNKLSIPKGSVPEELAQEIDKFSKGIWSDYTRKSQEISEKSKSLEAREAAVEKITNLSEDAQKFYSRGVQLREEIERLSGINTQSMWQSQNPEDRDRARQISDAISQKQAELQSIVGKLNQTEAEIGQAQQQEVARRKAEGEQWLERRIKGFKAEKLPAVIDYAVNTLGLSRKEAEGDWALNPAITAAVHKAMLYDQMQAARPKKGQTTKPAPAQKPVKPPKIGGGKATRDPDLVQDADKLSPDEWLRRRNQQLAKRAAG